MSYTTCVVNLLISLFVFCSCLPSRKINREVELITNNPPAEVVISGMGTFYLTDSIIIIRQENEVTVEYFPNPYKGNDSIFTLTNEEYKMFQKTLSQSRLNKRSWNGRIIEIRNSTDTIWYQYDYERDKVWDFLYEEKGNKIANSIKE